MFVFVNKDEFVELHSETGFLEQTFWVKGHNTYHVRYDRIEFDTYEVWDEVSYYDTMIKLS